MCFQGTETLQGGWWHVDKPFEWGLAAKNGKLGQGACPETHQMMTLVKASLKLRCCPRRPFTWPHVTG